MRGEVLFNTERCKGCSLCVQACPVHILALDVSRVNAVGYNPAYCMDMSKCIACANCATMCPDTVITVKRFDV